MIITCNVPNSTIALYFEHRVNGNIIHKDINNICAARKVFNMNSVGCNCILNCGYCCTNRITCIFCIITIVLFLMTIITNVWVISDDNRLYVFFFQMYLCLPQIPKSISYYINFHLMYHSFLRLSYSNLMLIALLCGISWNIKPC